MLLAGTGCGHGTHAGPAPDKAGSKTAAGPATVLTLATSGIAVPDAADFLDAVRRLSGGSLRIEPREVHRSDIDYERELIADARAGRVAMALVGARAFDLVGVTTLDPLVAPFVVQSYAQQERILESPLAGQMLSGVRALGLVGVALVPGALRHPIGVSRPIVTAADFEGARFGVRPSRRTAAALSALGAVPVPWLAGGPLAGLDATELDNEVLVSGYVRHSRSLLANVVLWPRTQAIVMNGAAYARLTRSQRDVLRQAAAAAVPTASAKRARSDAEGLQYLCLQAGFQVAEAAPADLATLRAKVGPLLAEIARDPASGPILRGIQALTARTPVSAALGGCPAGSTAAPTQAAPSGPALKLVGTWTHDVTKAALVAAHADPAEFGNSNTGPQELTLAADGSFRWASPQHPEDPDWPITGSWVAHGSELDLRSGPDSTSDPGPGGAFRCRWSLFRGKLKLDRIVDVEACPTPLVAVPWTRRR
jgi:TRAP-type C4-dicarboxylate transport system substrate-binding protein